jgi:AcrR family transcriptional regulator
MGGVAAVDDLIAGYRGADETQRRLVAAAVACIARWGVSKTSLDDIAREAGVSRATVYRALPGGKDRLVGVVLGHEVGRFFSELDAELAAADDLADLLTRGISRAMAEMAGNPALRTLLAHEPELILPHFAFHRMAGLFAVAVQLCRPHLARFLPEEAIRPTAEWAARLALTYSIHPVPAVRPHDPSSVRRLVDTYVMPALASPQEPS